VKLVSLCMACDQTRNREGRPIPELQLCEKHRSSESLCFRQNFAKLSERLDSDPRNRPRPLSLVRPANPSTVAVESTRDSKLDVPEWA
jgi:hypothetical protein